MQLVFPERCKIAILYNSAQGDVRLSILPRASRREVEAQLNESTIVLKRKQLNTDISIIQKKLQNFNTSKYVTVELDADLCLLPSTA